MVRDHPTSVESTAVETAIERLLQEPVKRSGGGHRRNRRHHRRERRVVDQIPERGPQGRDDGHEDRRQRRGRQQIRSGAAEDPVNVVEAVALHRKTSRDRQKSHEPTGCNRSDHHHVGERCNHRCNQQHRHSRCDEGHPPELLTLDARGPSEPNNQRHRTDDQPERDEADADTGYQIDRILEGLEGERVSERPERRLERRVLHRFREQRQHRRNLGDDEADSPTARQRATGRGEVEDRGQEREPRDETRLARHKGHADGVRPGSADDTAVQRERVARSADRQTDRQR